MGVSLEAQALFVALLPPGLRAPSTQRWRGQEQVEKAHLPRAWAGRIPPAPTSLAGAGHLATCPSKGV